MIVFIKGFSASGAAHYENNLFFINVERYVLQKHFPRPAHSEVAYTYYGIYIRIHHIPNLLVSRAAAPSITTIQMMLLTTDFVVEEPTAAAPAPVFIPH